MSRIGKLPIELPQGVSLKVDGNVVTVEGPKGKLEQKIRHEVTVSVEENRIVVRRLNESKLARSFHGLYRKLISNMVVGVTTGFSKSLVIIGVGYRVEMKGENLFFNLGYSNPIEFPLEEGLAVAIDGNNKLTISGMDNQQVGQICAEIRSLRPPEPYKGKGVRYENEYVRRKIGKAGIK
ncbi:MAG: 50S ribosomal protein L6 [Spirochaetales bacterium]|jgi:large subunit ribosomal protein L6|nr:50S ribosomal protein L6 [Spirochaetales bacterium]